MAITIERNQKIQILQIKDNIYIYMCVCVCVCVCVTTQQRNIRERCVTNSNVKTFERLKNIKES